MKSAMEVVRDTLGADALAGIGYEVYIPCMVAAIEADRAQRPEGREGTERVIFYWSRNHGDCYDCGNPAAFVAPCMYGDVRGVEKITIFCALCAANHAADGETIEWIEAPA